MCHAPQSHRLYSFMHISSPDEDVLVLLHHAANLQHCNVSPREGPGQFLGRAGAVSSHALP